MIKVGINGYGRIGRVAHRIIIQKHTDEIEVVAINAGRSTDLKGWMYLLKYDTSYGPLEGHELSVKETGEKTPGKPVGYLIIDGKEIAIFSEREIPNLPWKDLEIDTVIESTGVFTKFEDLKQHCDAGAKSVVLSAPYKGDTPIPTYVLGVNLQKDGKTENVVSNASCTTNCITPVAQVIEEAFGIDKAMMTTIHGYTSDQRLHDGGHKDYRRARAAAQNIIPTSTGATKAAAKAIQLRLREYLREWLFVFLSQLDHSLILLSW